MHINVLVRTSSGIPENIFEARRDEAWAGVDRGVFLLLKENILPEYAYGDFDSVTEEERAFIKERMDINPVPAEKDETDLEICLLDLVSEGYDSINIYGATGGRMDHGLGNLYLLLHPKLREKKISIIDALNVARLLPAGQHEIGKIDGMKYVSFLPFTDGTTVSLEGFLYDLDRKVLTAGSTLTISNEFAGSSAAVYTDSDILMIQSTD